MFDTGMHILRTRMRGQVRMKKNITCIPGDGIGPEVIAEAKKVLDAVADKFGHEFV